MSRWALSPTCASIKHLSVRVASAFKAHYLDGWCDAASPELYSFQGACSSRQMRCLMTCSECDRASHLMLCVMRARFTPRLPCATRLTLFTPAADIVRMPSLHAWRLCCSFLSPCLHTPFAYMALFLILLMDPIGTWFPGGFGSSIIGSASASSTRRSPGSISPSASATAVRAPELAESYLTPYWMS